MKKQLSKPVPVLPDVWDQYSVRSVIDVSMNYELTEHGQITQPMEKNKTASWTLILNKHKKEHMYAPVKFELPCNSKVKPTAFSRHFSSRESRLSLALGLISSMVRLTTDHLEYFPSSESTSLKLELWLSGRPYP